MDDLTLPAEGPVDEPGLPSPTRNPAPALAAKAPQAKKARNRAIALWLTGIGLTILLGLLHGHQWKGSAYLHTSTETAATMLAAIVGAMAMVRYYSHKANILLFVGAAFFGTAFLDGYHAVVTSPFFKPYMPSDLPALIPWSWVASRLFLSVMLFLSWVAWRRESRLGKSGRVSEKTVFLFTGSLTVASFLFFVFAPLPRAYYDEYTFHRPEEFVPAFFFLLAFENVGRTRIDALDVVAIPEGADHCRVA